MATVAAGFVLVVGILSILAFNEAADSCYYDDDDCVDNAFMTYGILSFIGGLLWVTSGILVFIFACGQRLETAIEKVKEDQSSSGAENNDLGKVEPTIQAVPTASAAATTTVTITHLPDGSIQKKTEVFNPADGSKTVTISVEKPDATHDV